MLTPAVLGWAEFDALAIPPRPALLGDWFKAGDYGVVFGRRGLGKSWLSLALACALAQGRDLGPWKCPAPRRVLYVDGEMDIGDFRGRVRSLDGGCNNLLTLSHQCVFDRSKASLCASEKSQQTEITRYCEGNKIDVLVLDNGACLFRGVKENDADDFRDVIEGWLLDLRRRGIAVILVLHAGRNNAIRGSSKKEDAAFWILRLDEVSGGGGAGARFLTRFAKNRNAVADPPPIDWHLEPVDGKTRITHRIADPMVIFRQWIEDGLTNCGEIAEEMGVTRGTVSKMATRAIREGWLSKKGREYAIV
ncbi:MAG: AAA family ATPase [Opitutaceae bacterium]|nr:AAA family ATPase [Opitutaceae bacterium]